MSAKAVHECPKCHREVKPHSNLCPFCATVLVHLPPGAYAVEEALPVPSPAKLFLLLFAMPWRVFALLRGGRLRAGHFLMLTGVVIVGLAAGWLAEGLNPDQSPKMTPLKIVAPLLAQLGAIFILSILSRIVQFYFGEEIGLAPTLAVLLVVFAAFNLLRLVTVWAFLGAYEDRIGLRYVVRLWSFVISDESLSSGGYLVLLAISRVFYFVIWFYLLLALTFMGIRLFGMNPFISFFLAAFGIALYVVAFEVLLGIMGVGGYFLERAYDETLMERRR